jgi:hypothetical protein
VPGSISMRAFPLGVLIAAAVTTIHLDASAQPPPAPAAAPAPGEPSTAPPAPPPPAPVVEPGLAPPPPSAAAATTPSGETGREGSELEEWYPNDTWSDPAYTAPPGLTSTAQFRSYGFFRAPLRIGEGTRPACPAGDKVPAIAPGLYDGQPWGNYYCALPNQSRTTFHTPYLPDDNYFSWGYTRTWEKAWTEVYMSYGTSRVFGTVGIEAYDFTDVSVGGNQADPAQFGIGQGWLTILPSLPIDKLNLDWKVGAFSEKFGSPSKNGGPYDTYAFGRTRQIGESLTASYDLGDVTLKAEHGFGAHLENVVAGKVPTGNPMAQNSYTSAMSSTILGASAGFTLLNHAHAGIDYKHWLQIGLHYLNAWSQDDRIQGTLGINGNPGGPDGSLAVYGAEARLMGHGWGDFYVAYSHINATNVTLVGPAFEVMHADGGGGHNGASGIYETYFNDKGNGDGDVDNLLLQYDVSVTHMLRKLAHASTGETDITLSLFGMYSAVSNTSPDSVSPYGSGTTLTAGTTKLKYGADVAVFPVSWLGVGVRGDYVQPDSHQPSLSFGSVAPRIMFRTHLLGHAQATLQYGHYWDGSYIIPTQSVSSIGAGNLTTGNTGLYPLDKDVFGIKATLVW